MRTSLLVLSLLLLTQTLPLAGCVESEDITGGGVSTQGPSTAGTSDKVVLHEDVILVEESECLSSVDVSTDREVLVFEFTCDPADLGIEPGRIVVGVADGGYLRRVVSVTYDGWVLTLLTEEASIAEAIASGSMSVSISDPSPGARSVIDFGNTMLYYGDVGPATVSARLDTAYIDFDPFLEMDGHWEDGEVQDFDSSIGISIDGDIRASLSSTNGLRFDRNQDIAGWSWPFAFAIGPLPVVGVVQVKIKAGFRLDSPGHITAAIGAAGALNYRTENSYKNGQGWTENNIAENNWALHQPDFNVSTSATAKVYVRAEVTGMLYGVAGPSSRSDLDVSGKATAGCDGIQWDLTAGFSSKVLVRLNILDKFKPTKTFAKAKFTADLASGMIDWPLDIVMPCGQELIRCNQKVSGDSGIGYDARLDGYSCNVGNYDAPEAIWKWTSGADQTVVWRLIDPVPTEVNHDVMVLDGAWGLVTAECLDWGSNSVEFEAQSGHSYYLVVDGYDNDAGPFEAMVECASDGTDVSGGSLGATDPF